MYRIVNKSTENIVIAGCLENKWGTINEKRDIDIDFFVVVNLMMIIILLLN
jgi:hypothetical protein